MVIARGMRPTLNVSSTSFWNPSFSSRMATGNKPPYAVRLLPSKSYGVEAPILLGSGITRSAPCGTRLSSLCSLLRLTIWVTPRSRLAKLELRGLSVLQQDFRGPQVVLSFSPSYSTQRPCIGQVVLLALSFSVVGLLFVTQSQKAIGLAPSLRLIAKLALPVGIGTRRALPVRSFQFVYQTRGLARHHDEAAAPLLVRFHCFPTVKTRIHPGVDRGHRKRQGRENTLQMARNLLP